VRVSERVHIVGSGESGFDLSDPLDCHVYLVDGGDELALIDTGVGRSTEMLVDAIEAAGLDPNKLRHILLTHGHGDHVGGAAAIKERFPRAQVAASALLAPLIARGDESRLCVDRTRQGGWFPEEPLRACGVDCALRDGSEIRVGDARLTVIETPGHCAGHIAFLLEHGSRRSLFSGDAVFVGGEMLLLAIPDANVQDQIASLRKLRGLDVDALYPGHGRVSAARGQTHIERANLALDGMLLPTQFLAPW
jgi:hydroxyacylglutathione hydrolase